MREDSSASVGHHQSNIGDILMMEVNSVVVKLKEAVYLTFVILLRNKKLCEGGVVLLEYILN